MKFFKNCNAENKTYIKRVLTSIEKNIKQINDYKNAIKKILNENYNSIGEKCTKRNMVYKKN